MNRKVFILVGLAFILGMGDAMSQENDSIDEDEMDATMRLMGKAEAESPDTVTTKITLPDHVLKRDPESPAVGASAHGLATANENQQHRVDGQTKANEARDRAAEMSEQAKDNRENHGRSEDRPDPPGRPDNPGPPG